MIGIYLNEWITWVQPAAKDKYGNPVTGSASGAGDTETRMRARVKWETRLVRNQAGEEVRAKGSVLMQQMPGHNDFLRISGNLYPILAVEEKQDWAIRCYRAWLA